MGNDKLPGSACGGKRGEVEPEDLPALLVRQIIPTRHVPTPQ
jgi:hypothetical protein